MEQAIALVALAAMEIVLGIDNIVFIVILVGRLPERQQAKARLLGLALAMVTRIGLLFALQWLLGLESAIFTLTDLGVPASWLTSHAGEINEHVNGVSWRDIILLAGGLFLIGKSVHEIHEKFDGPHEEHVQPKQASFVGTLAAIAVIDIVFSLDSVITAVGMAKDIWIMVAAIMIAVGVMMAFAGPVSRFVERKPTLKMLALSFLILIGVMLVSESIGTPINKGYIYFAMAFALGVEVLNLRLRSRLLAAKSLQTLGGKSD